jgi:hypothetical protein
MNTAASFSSFAKKSVSSIKPPFGSKDLRFDGKLELKEYFNKEPGPGCYSEKKDTFEQNTYDLVSRMKGLDGQPIIQDFQYKEKRFRVSADMLTSDPTIMVGPGQHDPKMVLKHVAGPKMDYKGDFSIPFNEKNPLNYVKPITVNIYFKQSNPGVGQYNPKKPEKHVPSAVGSFKTKVVRDIVNPKALEMAAS